MKRMLKGFTLVEIMIVVAIIAILAAVAIPNFVRYRKTSQMNACISNLKQIQAAVEQAKMSGVKPSFANARPTSTSRFRRLAPRLARSAIRFRRTIRRTRPAPLAAPTIRTLCRPRAKRTMPS